MRSGRIVESGVLNNFPGGILHWLSGLGARSEKLGRRDGHQENPLLSPPHNLLGEQGELLQRKRSGAGERFGLESRGAGEGAILRRGRTTRAKIFQNGVLNIFFLEVDVLKPFSLKFSAFCNWKVDGF